MSSNDRIDRVLADLRPDLPGPRGAPRGIADRMAELATTGCSVAVIDALDVAWAEGFGVRKAGAPDAVVPSTPFQAGSISKPVFALAVMRLVQDGVLDLDAEIGTYLTSWRLPPASDGWTPRITLRQLLSHTAGTTVHGFPGYPASGPWPTLPQTLNGERPANMLPVYVDLIPGTQFRYSGGGTTIAQLAVMDATGRPFPALMHDLVLGPLGMADSSFEQPPSPALAGRAATAHPWNGVPVAGDWHVYPEMAAAGLWSTAGDLARLGSAVLRGLRGDPTPLGLRSETLAAMLKPQLQGQAVGTEYVGLGWACNGKDDGFRFGHTGGNEGFLAQLRLYPARGQGAVVMNNSLQGWPLRLELLGAIGREYDFPPEPETTEPADDSASTDHGGCYRTASGMAFRVEQTATQLLLRVDGQEPLPLTPSPDGSYTTPLPKQRVRFATTPACGTAMSITQGGMTIKAERRPE